MPRLPRGVAEVEAPAPKAMSQGEWEAQEPCKYCGQRAGQNPATGVWVRSWDAANKEFVEGHRIDCQRFREERRP